MDTTEAAQVADAVYSSDDADAFYREVWGGEDIHVGWYAAEDEDVAVASRRALERIAERVEDLLAGGRVVDLGSGFCGPARYLVRRFGCHVTALNISEVQNRRARELNAEVSLSDRIDVRTAAFEDIPAGDATFDVAWSQEALLHSADRARVFSEVARVLRPGGAFVFTDPMRADGTPVERLTPVLDRLRLPDLATPSTYRSYAEDVGFDEVGFEERTDLFTAHYRRVLEETERREHGRLAAVDRDWIERAKRGLRHWVEAGRDGRVVWGVFHLARR